METHKEESGGPKSATEQAQQSARVQAAAMEAHTALMAAAPRSATIPSSPVNSSSPERIPQTGIFGRAGARRLGLATQVRREPGTPDAARAVGG